MLIGKSQQSGVQGQREHHHSLYYGRCLLNQARLIGGGLAIGKKQIGISGSAGAETGAKRAAWWCGKQTGVQAMSRTRASVLHPGDLLVWDNGTVIVGLLPTTSGACLDLPASVSRTCCPATTNADLLLTTAGAHFR
ncbi:unnamed protein product [Linum trigynum]|uniref:Uncharacterized protein n=1 Tax=Linum trigynum TaxID=586398 RepID=A0AAV2E1D5_9ROSI